MPRISIKIIREVVAKKIGNDVLELVEMLKRQGEMSEFALANELKEDINSVRNKLYRLQHQNLVTFRKRKDEVKGWYVYFWRINHERFRYIYREMLERELERVENQIECLQSGEFFMCQNRCLVVEFEDALNSNYLCPECGSVLVQCDNSKEISKLIKKRDKLKKAMERCS
ncbi:hypothetical protein DRJ48_04745 [Candidatus Woesearchaeota archaeon]|nr:hypothetical protein [Candidatus Woesearchaeota archaeon]RLE41846.1 MAG: hypothetical protein DRJ48_04745 [Candidatus Woesearchaeota archaeon]